MHGKSAPVPAILIDVRFSVFVSFVDDDMTDRQAKVQGNDSIIILDRGAPSAAHRRGKLLPYTCTAKANTTTTVPTTTTTTNSRLSSMTAKE